MLHDSHQGLIISSISPKKKAPLAHAQTWLSKARTQAVVSCALMAICAVTLLVIFNLMQLESIYGKKQTPTLINTSSSRQHQAINSGRKPNDESFLVEKGDRLQPGEPPIDDTKRQKYPANRTRHPLELEDDVDAKNLMLNGIKADKEDEIQLIDDSEWANKINKTLADARKDKMNSHEQPEPLDAANQRLRQIVKNLSPTTKANTQMLANAAKINEKSRVAAGTAAEMQKRNKLTSSSALSQGYKKTAAGEKVEPHNQTAGENQETQEVMIGAQKQNKESQVITEGVAAKPAEDIQANINTPHEQSGKLTKRSSDGSVASQQEATAAAVTQGAFGSSNAINDTSSTTETVNKLKISDLNSRMNPANGLLKKNVTAAKGDNGRIDSPRVGFAGIEGSKLILAPRIEPIPSGDNKRSQQPAVSSATMGINQDIKTGVSGIDASDKQPGANKEANAIEIDASKKAEVPPPGGQFP